MAPSESDPERLLSFLKRDVAATVGAAHEVDVDDFARHGRTFITDQLWFAQWLVESVQQYFHDTHLDTTWPACPRHPNHPLWFKEGSWWCERDRVALAPLGALSSIPGEAT